MALSYHDYGQVEENSYKTTCEFYLKPHSSKKYMILLRKQRVRKDIPRDRGNHAKLKYMYIKIYLQERGPGSYGSALHCIRVSRDWTSAALLAMGEQPFLAKLTCI